MNRMIALEKNPVLRLAPLFVKDLILEFATYLSARDTTTTVSNLGQIAIDERLAPYIRNINVLTSTTGINFLLSSFGNDLSIGISSVYSNPDIIKNFCRYFSNQGIEGTININKTSEEVAEDRLEAKFETSVKRLGGQVPASEEDEPQPKKAKAPRKPRRAEEPERAAKPEKPTKPKRPKKSLEERGAGNAEV